MKNFKVLVQLSVFLESGETKTHSIRYPFDEFPAKSCVDLQAYVSERFADKYGPLKFLDIEVKDNDFDPPVYVVAENEALLVNGQWFKIRAEPSGMKNRAMIGNASKDQPRAAKPAPSTKNSPPPAPTEFKCPVCYDQFAVRDGVACQAEHLFCQECVRGFVTSNALELPLPADLNGVICLTDGCDVSIGIATLRKVISSEILNLLEERCRSEMMRKFSSFEGCKTEFCVAVVEFSQSPQQTQYFHCPACTAAFCRMCKRDKIDHVESTCDEMTERERVESERKRQAEVAKRTDINRLTKEIDEAKIRKCPSCGQSALKNLGDGSCNKMTCACGAKYCYLCLSSGIGYDHFVDEGDGCKLFGDAEEFDRVRLADLQGQLDGLVLS